MRHPRLSLLTTITLLSFFFLLSTLQPLTSADSPGATEEVPLVLTMPPVLITPTAATLRGILLDDGGSPCTTWFSWDDYPLTTECAGLIATGSVVRDNRSIFWKNRHFNANNQKPYFYQGTNYSYYGIGQTYGMCRMGLNTQGLAIGNFDISGSILPEKRCYLSDRSTGGEDQDMHIVLGNYSTVADAAYYLARHGSYTCQLGIVSAEPGVGAIVTIGADGYTNITWVNNTYVALGNAIYCNGQFDSKMLRITELVQDIITNNASCYHDGLLNHRDVIRRLAKDIDSGYGVHSEPYGEEGTYYASGINPSTARSAMVAVCGNQSFDGAVNIAWLSFGQTTHLSLFVPLGASYLLSNDTIPKEFTNGTGLEQYTDVKQAYAEQAPNRYYRSRVREIHTYTSHNENLTFDEYDTLMASIMTAAHKLRAIIDLKQFADAAMRTALHAYITNCTVYAVNTTPEYNMSSRSKFTLRLEDLSPGTVYYVMAYAQNNETTANGTQHSFMTPPTMPLALDVQRLGQHHVRLVWQKGLGAQYTVIERHTCLLWQRGSGQLVYNGTGLLAFDLNLPAHERYYYRLWSYTTAEGHHEYSLCSNLGTIYLP